MVSNISTRMKGTYKIEISKSDRLFEFYKPEPHCFVKIYGSYYYKEYGKGRYFTIFGNKIKFIWNIRYKMRYNYA